MLYKGMMGSEYSGKMGGVVAAHNKGGYYFRQAVIPTNPGTTRQNAIRNYMTQLTTAWQNTLTAAQRLAWQTYADNITWFNALGDAIQIGGNACYNACNIPRLQASLTRVDAGPVIFSRPTLTLPVPTITAASTSVSVAFTNTDAWANEVGGAMLLYGSTAQASTINFWKGPFQFIGKIAGAATPPTTPSVFTMPNPAGPTGSRMFFRVTCVRADGRLSPDFFLTGTV